MQIVRRIEIDVIDLEQSEIAFPFFGRTDFARNGVAGMEIKTANLAGGNINIIRTGEIGAFCGTQETKAVGEDFKDAITMNIFALFCLRF